LLGSIIGGNKAKKGVDQATAAQTAAYQQGIDEQRRQFDVTRADYAPYLQAGLQGLSGVGNFVGTNGADAQAQAIAQLQQSPFYQSLYGNGQEALLQNGAATGGLRGGNMQGALADFGRDTLATTIDRQTGLLGGLAGMGMGATDSVSGFGAQTANNVTNLLGQIGGAKASGYLAKAGIRNQTWQNIGGFADSVASSVMGGGAGGLSSGLASIFKGGF